MSISYRILFYHRCSILFGCPNLFAANGLGLMSLLSCRRRALQLLNLMLSLSVIQLLCTLCTHCEVCGDRFRLFSMSLVPRWTSKYTPTHVVCDAYHLLSLLKVSRLGSIAVPPLSESHWFLRVGRLAGPYRLHGFTDSPGGQPSKVWDSQTRER